MCDFDMNMDDVMPFDSGMENPIDDNPIDIWGSGSHSLFSSGFDDEHPLPSYDELRNAGFSDYLAHHISEGGCHSYSESELYHVLYESDDPVSAYNDMMDGKAQAAINKADQIIDSIEKSGLLGTSSVEDISDTNDAYNSSNSQTTTEKEPKLSLADCWPACKIATGDVSNNATFGFHA